MFGHVQANLADLSQEETIRYKSVYCGLCRCLGNGHGFFSRFALTYDLTFLTLLLSSLYEPEETAGESRCMGTDWSININVKSPVHYYHCQ